MRKQRIEPEYETFYCNICNQEIKSPFSHEAHIRKHLREDMMELLKNDYPNCIEKCAQLAIIIKAI